MEQLIFLTIIFAGITSGALLEPDSGILTGVNLDYDEYTPTGFNATTKVDHAFFVVFTGWPPDYNSLSQQVVQISGARGALVVTPMPWSNPDAITDSEIAVFADHLSDYVYNYDVPVLVRFAHEMNGSWYPYGCQPVRYTNAFTRLAKAVHAVGPNAGMVWGVANFEGYPFSHNGNNLAAYLASSAPHGTAEDFNAMDTNNDGILTDTDDPYGPYYPGDEVVDWTGSSLYHVDNSWPPTQNSVPYNRKVTSMLTGHGNALRNVYKRFAADKNKPFMIPETSAAYIAEWGGASDAAVKAGWVNQLYHAGPTTSEAESLPYRYPWIKAVGWFDIEKYEKVNGTSRLIDWRISNPFEVRTNYYTYLKQVFNGNRYFITAPDVNGFVYGWNGWLNEWQSVNPGSTISLSSTAYKGQNSLLLDYDGGSTNDIITVAAKTEVLYDAKWLDNDTITLHARVPAGTNVFLAVVLQSDITARDNLGVQTVFAGDDWSELKWEYNFSNHFGATWLSISFVFENETNIAAQLLVDTLSLVIFSDTTNVPAPPTNVMASDNTYTDKVRVVWTGNKYAKGYKVYRDTTSNSSSATVIAADTGLFTYYDDTSVIPGRIYYYWVKASNSYGLSEFSVSDSGSASIASFEILNPGFEIEGSGGASDASDWNQWEAYRTSERSHSGNWSMRVNSGPGWHNAFQTFSHPDLSGELVTVDVWGYTTGLTGGNGGMLKLQKAGTTEAYTSVWFITTSSPVDTWIMGSATAALPEGVTDLDIVFLIDGVSPTTGNIYFDDVSIIIPEPGMGIWIVGLLELWIVGITKRVPGACLGQTSNVEL